MDSYDYVIVGGGTAGCILANRLTASGRHRVLMLEAGGEPNGMWIPIPAGFSKLLVDPKFNWRFQTEPEEGTRGRAIAVPRGKGLGGSTLINGMIYVRGQPQDYDGWQAAGAHGWGWSEVEPYFRKLENYARGDDPRRGHDGPMHVEQVAERYPLTDAFLQAAVEDGQRLADDYNLADQEGFGYYQVAQRRGRRWSVVDGYLKPARSRPNLRVETGAHVLRVNIEGRRCVGVAWRRADGSEAGAGANIEVILASGAVQTPQLLELSGIGRPALLESLGIAVRHPLYGVGENYIDHYATRMNWRVKNTVTLNEMSRGLPLASQVMRYLTRRSGILTLGTGLVHGFVKTRRELATPDVQYFFVHASYADASKRILDRAPGMTIGVAQLRPQSVGTIHLRSPDPSAGPAIRPNFLAAEEDRRSLVGGMKIARRIVGRPALADYVDHEMSPGPGVVWTRTGCSFRARQRADDLPPDRHLPHGRRRAGGGRRAAAAARAGRPARRRRLGDAEDGLGQHAGGGDDGRREGRRPDPRRRPRPVRPSRPPRRAAPPAPAA